MLNDMKRFFYKLMKNKLNVFTALFVLVSIVVFGVIIMTFTKNEKTIEEIFSFAADYVSICSCILVLIQVIAFVKDSRKNEYRTRKTFALDLAKTYATELIVDMAFIQNVLSFHYYSASPESLYNLLMNIDIEEFTSSELKKHIELNEYCKIFDGNSLEIPYELILEQATIFGVFDLDDLRKIDGEKRKIIANKKFRCFISDTMNKLEYFSMSVNQHIAEGDMLYASLHQSYIKFIHYMYPYICKYNQEYETFYTNVIDLFRAWDNERKKDEKYVRDSKQKTALQISRRYKLKSNRISEK